MRSLTHLPEDSIQLSQEHLELLCKTFYYNFTQEDLLDEVLNIEDQKTFIEIFKKIKSEKKHNQILKLNYIASPIILYKLAVSGIEVYAIENKSGNTGESPSFSFHSIFSAFFIVISK